LEAVRGWHLERGFSDIGYHFLILNGYVTPEKLRAGAQGYNPSADGVLATGRPLSRMGAHVRGYNYGSIGIALVGVAAFTEKQMETLERQVRYLMEKFPSIQPDRVRGHREVNGEHPEQWTKACPRFHVKGLRLRLTRG